jgi:predicted AlkP superfamily phosphohydrolase/phosphomutase
MGTRLLIIGIDALDSRQIAKYRDVLPTLSRLTRNCPKIVLRSIVPPDSDTAWASIYTGWNPARHGLVGFLDPLEKSARHAAADAPNQILRGNTFWDVASRAGKRVCVLLPHLGYPAWPVNGVMIGRSALRDDVDARPRSDFDARVLESLNVVKGMPGRNKESYIRKNKQLFGAQSDFAADLLVRGDWDLFFVYSSVLDMIQHYFWDLCDEKDPSYPGGNPFRGTIRDFYVLHDRMVADLLSRVEPGTAVFVLSDHGHAMRPARLFNANEFLRRRGWLAVKGKPGGRGAPFLMDRTKNAALEVMGKYGLGNAAAALLRWAPWIRNLYTRPSSIDWTNTVAYATNLSGVKAYSYNGIGIVRGNLGAKSYEEVRDSILRELAEVTDPETGEKIVRRMRRREEVYAGPFLSKFPDVLLELDEGLGAGMTPDGSLFGHNFSHSIVPGSHSGEGAVFLIHQPPFPVGRGEADLVDVAPTVLDALGVECPAGLDGATVFRR